jgi:hypothetical protein
MTGGCGYTKARKLRCSTRAARGKRSSAALNATDQKYDPRYWKPRMTSLDINHKLSGQVAEASASSYSLVR